MLRLPERVAKMGEAYMEGQYFPGITVSFNFGLTYNTGKSAV